MGHDPFPNGGEACQPSCAPHSTGAQFNLQDPCIGSENTYDRIQGKHILSYPSKRLYTYVYI